MDYTKYVDEMKQVDRMSCKPDFKRLKVGDIVDEDKSVKWNREYVEENRKKYDEEVKRLNTLKNKTKVDIQNRMVRDIAKETGTSETVAKMIYNMAYQDTINDDYFYRYSNFADKISDLIDLVSAAAVKEMKKK